MGIIAVSKGNRKVEYKMETRTISTCDLQLAAFLQVSGCQIGRIEGPQTRRMFTFEYVPAALLRAYEQDQPVALSPRALFNSYFDLKRRVFMSTVVEG